MPSPAAGTRPAMAEELDPVRRSSNSRVTSRLDRERAARVAAAVQAPQSISERIRSLDTTWDIERTLEANAATLSLVGLAFVAARPSKKRLAVAAIVPAFLLQHALQGWCPPIEVFRMLGRRSRNELDAERTALKAVRGDFDGLPSAPPAQVAEQALQAAGRR